MNDPVGMKTTAKEATLLTALPKVFRQYRKEGTSYRSWC
jgi:hypothetical protein